MTDIRTERSSAIVLFVLFGIVIAGAAAYAAFTVFAPQPLVAISSDGLAKTSAKGLYLAKLEPDINPIRINAIHTWTLTVTTPDGSPVEGATIGIDGGMPTHGHGLPTAPQVTQSLGQGRYLIEGMRFNMTGTWVLNVSIAGPAGADAASFTLPL